MDGPYYGGRDCPDRGQDSHVHPAILEGHEVGDNDVGERADARCSHSLDSCARRSAASLIAINISMF
ncbi:hypothetical protein K439DRAFT_1638874 [Ramaria rubella]|nr:hypothetical protein K439DRAFT_1643270 [Ramaria rubella]KAF8578391.1 hypothetical protein K439DRAFT_1638874 [Ramaria rubella]